jgi:hypothetical protein
MIDITSFEQRTIPELLIIVYNNKSRAELFSSAKDYLNAGKPALFAKIEKVSNKREKHEICCTEGVMFVGEEKYTFNKGFIRAELLKIVPKRLIIEY